MEQEQAGSELVMASAKARVSHLIEDFKKCTPWRSGFNRIDWPAQIRDAVWEGMSADGKKHDTEDAPAFPWDGASDARVFAADDICNALAGLCVVGFFGSMIRFAGVEAKDGEAAGDATRFMERLIQGPGFAELLSEVELSAQYFVETGVMVLHPVMEREVAYEMKRISLAELAKAAGMTNDENPNDKGMTNGAMTNPQGDPNAKRLLELVMNPAMEAEAIEFVQTIGEEIKGAEFADFLSMFECEAVEEWRVTEARAKEFVRGLREEGYGCIPVPVVTRNEATVTALRAWDEVFFRSYAVDLVKQARVYRREFMDEVGLRAKAAVEGWDAAWVEEAVKTKGKSSEWSGNSFGTALGSADWSASGSFAEGKDQEDLIEVIYGYQRAVEEDGVTSYWVTVFSAHAGDGSSGASPSHQDSFCAAHEQVSADEVSFVMGLLERRGRGVQRVRGIPERVGPRQREMKCHRDALVDLASMAVIPPVNVQFNAMKLKYKFGPGVQNTVSPGMAPEFMDVPTKGAPVAVEILQSLKEELKEEFGLGGKEADPTLTASKRQMVVMKFLGAWTVALQGLWRLALKFTSDQEYERITGGPKPQSMEARKGEDLVLHFDVRDLDMGHLKEVYAAVKELTLVDTGGVIDRNKLVSVIMRKIDSSMAREVVTPAQGASQQLYRKVQTDLVMMMAGLEPEFREDDNPTAGKELEFAERIVQGSPKMQQALKSDPDFQEKAGRWMESRKFNLQQQENKVIGRIGVAPKSEEAVGI